MQRAAHMRHANLEEHYWRLQSGETRHAAHPDSFWIPSRDEREHLKRGQAARLLFELEGESEDSVERAVERMWVIVAERVGDGYIGILDNEPASLEPGPTVYLTEGAEIPFWPEHVIDIADPPPEWIAHRLGVVPTRRWPRNDDGRVPRADAAV
jgi:hypothetical protein